MPPVSPRLTLRLTQADLVHLQTAAATSVMDVTAYARAALGLPPTRKGGARPGSGPKPKSKPQVKGQS